VPDMNGKPLVTRVRFATETLRSKCPRAKSPRNKRCHGRPVDADRSGEDLCRPSHVLSCKWLSANKFAHTEVNNAVSEGAV